MTDRPFSNYGRCVDMFAPGRDIISASRKSDTSLWPRCSTSMACPHGAGAAAFILRQNPELSPRNVTANRIAKATKGSIAKLPSCPVSPNLLLFVDQSSPELFLAMPPTFPSSPLVNTTTSTCGFESALNPYCGPWQQPPGYEIDWSRNKGTVQG